MAKKMIYGMVFALLLTLCFASAEVYDDFSGGFFNTSLWTETTDTTASGNLDEYYLDTTNENYHTAQLTAGDRGILLLLDQEFQDGDTLTYELNYQSGSGNIIGREYIDGNYLDLIAGSDMGYIGYWTGGDIHDFGTYYVSVTFAEDSASFEITHPDGEVWTYTATGLTAPYSYGVATRTGHNGIGHIDYDNFELISNSTEEEIDELEERVETLEDTIETLETTVIDLQTQIDTLESTSNNHETRITSLENLMNIIVRKVNRLWKVVRP